MTTHVRFCMSGMLLYLVLVFGLSLDLCRYISQTSPSLYSLPHIALQSVENKCVKWSLQNTLLTSLCTKIIHRKKHPHVKSMYKDHPQEKHPHVKSMCKDHPQEKHKWPLLAGISKLVAVCKKFILWTKDLWRSWLLRVYTVFIFYIKVEREFQNVWLISYKRKILRY